MNMIRICSRICWKRSKKKEERSFGTVVKELITAQSVPAVSLVNTLKVSFVWDLFSDSESVLVSVPAVDPRDVTDELLTEEIN